MKATSLIRHAEKQRLVLVREDYLNICDNDHCRAALLSVVEYWTSKKLEPSRKHETSAGFFYNTLSELSEHLLGLYGEEKLARSMEYLVERNFVERRHNPKVKWDRTYQYRLNTPVVQAAVDIWASWKDANGDSSVIETSKSGNGKRYSGDAIPETSTETSSKESTTVRPSAHGADKLVEYIPALQASEDASPNRSASKRTSSWPTDHLLNEVASKVFGAALPLDEVSGARAGKIAKWLRSRGATSGQLDLFIEWYQSEYPVIHLPRDVTKFAEAWQRWCQAGVDKTNTEAYLEELDENDEQFSTSEQRRLLAALPEFQASGQ